MDTVDKVAKVETVEVKRKPGRPARQDKATPLGEYIAEEAKKSRKAKERNPVVDKYYELNGTKLLLCKKVKSGTVYKTFIGSTTDKKNGQELKAFMDRMNKDGKLRIKV